MSGAKKAGFWQRLLGIGSEEGGKEAPAQKEPPRHQPPKEEPPTPKPSKKEPPERKRPPKTTATTLKAPPPAGPKEMSGERPPEERPPESRKKGTPHSPEDDGPQSPKPGGGGGTTRKGSRRKRAESGTGEAPPPAGPAVAPDAPPPEERPPGTREKGSPETPPVAPVEAPRKRTDDTSRAPAQSTKPRRGWFAELRDGLSRSSAALGDNLASVFTRRRLDEETLDDLEEALIKSDLGVAMAARIRAKLASGRFDRGISPEDLREVLASEIAAVLEPVAKPLPGLAAAKPQVILIVGVNGTGKTTTAAKLAYRLIEDGRTVLLAAADTFRAAAIDQLKVWGARVGAEVVTKDVGADPAGVAYEALERAKAERRDVLIIDTAGRLQNKSDLMAELAKIVRVLKKLDPDAPHEVLLVLDATTGQNAISQVDIFREISGVTGLILTKLDGTARGGILVALAERFGIPVNAIGIGEGVDDLRPFDAQDFARAIAGLDVKNARAA